jgi:3-phenylpropionate/trans-cinnamate dioxygenase ferredoxin reductase subunit
MPHDCRSGHCGTCTVRIRDGLAIGGDCGTDGMVKACQARVLTDLDVLVEPVPDAVTTRGVITGLQPLAPDIAELRIHLAKPITYLPGQYYKFQFAGFPARCFSPTQPMQQSRDDNSIRLHIRKVAGGRVSSELGLTIRNGHPVLLRGPYGAAYLRPGGDERLVLVSSGTGFAPIWSIARAALRENPRRPIVLVVGGKDIDGLYMGAAARMVGGMRNVTIIPVIDKLSAGVARMVLQGRPTDHLPPLEPNDIVYACGAPPMVEAVRERAKEGGATFYADPFVPQADETLDSFFSRVIDRVGNLKLPMGVPRIPAAQPPARLPRPK